jgi:hypothetical protein
MTGPWFLYLDESGDLGFNPDKPGRSRNFTICILAVSTTTRNRTVASAVKKTLARMILEQLPMENASDAVNLVLDKRKNRKERQEFNAYIQRELASRLPPKVRLRITHEDSANNHCLQAADLFCWGIFRKYAREDTGWYEVFQGKVRYDSVYLPPK